MTLPSLIELAKTYAHERTVLAERVSALEAEVQASQRRRLPGIKSALAAAADAKANLEQGIDNSRALFDSPRTATHFGIKFGIKKGAGKIEFGNEAGVIARIKKLFGEAKAAVLIKTTEKLQKKALSTLPADDLKRIGCTVGDTGDHVFIAAEDTAVDKLVERLLKEGSGEEISDSQDA